MVSIVMVRLMTAHIAALCVMFVLPIDLLSAQRFPPLCYYPTTLDHPAMIGYSRHYPAPGLCEENYTLYVQSKGYSPESSGVSLRWSPRKPFHYGILPVCVASSPFQMTWRKPAII